MSSMQSVSALRRVGIAAAATAIVTGGVATGSAHAATLPRPDLAGGGPVRVLVANNASLSAAVKNVGAFTVGTTFASIRLQQVSRLVLAGQTHYVNTPGASPITGVGTVDPILASAEARFSAAANAIPQAGQYRVTVCADSANFVLEASETNNCVSEIQTVVPFFIGG